MPFTLCHPAIIIPLHRAARRYTSLPALVIGSMMPDFPYFFSLGVGGTFSHSLAGILAYCVPMGALLYVEYVVVLRQPLLAWLPAPVSTRLPSALTWPAERLRLACVVLLSLAIGAASHIGWDAFTHQDGLPVLHYAPLRALVPVAGIRMPLFRVLQHASSLLGFIAIAVYARRWFVDTVPGPHPHATLGSRERLGALAAVGAAGVAGTLGGLLQRDATSFEYVDKVVSAHEVRCDAELGQRRALHASSVGLVLLAMGPAVQAARYLAAPALANLTPRTQSDPKALQRELALVRKRGYAVTRDTNAVGASGIAAPVFGPGGRLLGALNVSAPTSRFDAVLAHAGALVRAAAQLSADVAAAAGRLA